MLHSYHLSLSLISENGYIPRVSDDRVGYFTTLYQDYTNTMQETQYVRFINRWNLKKKYPQDPISEPVEPIVFWLENTIPHEYRKAVRNSEGMPQYQFENVKERAKSVKKDFDLYPELLS